MPVMRHFTDHGCPKPQATISVNIQAFVQLGQISSLLSKGYGSNLHTSGPLGRQRNIACV